MIFSCYTSVGRHRGKNILMLEANNEATCAEHDIVIHELMHVSGYCNYSMLLGTGIMA